MPVPMPRRTTWLQVKIVGDNDSLGAWAVDEGVRMQWTEGHDWVAELNLSPDLNTFKVCRPKCPRVTRYLYVLTSWSDLI